MKQSILIFDHIYPNAVTEFVFDQSSAHGAFAKDALNAKEMKVRSGEKQQKMHDTFIPMDNPNPEHCGMPQAMVFPLDLPPTHPDFELCGQLKGMFHVMEECGLISILQAAVTTMSNSGPGNNNSGRIAALQRNPGCSQAFPVPDSHPRCDPCSKLFSDTTPLRLPFLDPVTFLGPRLPFV